MRGKILEQLLVGGVFVASWSTSWWGIWPSKLETLTRDLSKIFQKSQMPRDLPGGGAWAVLELKGTLVTSWILNVIPQLPGNGPSPGGRNNVPRILPSLTGTLFTPSAMNDFWNVPLENGSSDVSRGITWPSKQFTMISYGTVTSLFNSRIPSLCPGACFMLHINPMGSTPQ